MYVFDYPYRIRYADTDKMGYLYYGNYAMLYEIGRTESLRSLGTSYKDLEDSGIMLPVYDLKSSFIKPALYDEELVIKTIIKTLPTVRIHFRYEIFKKGNDLINIGETTLVFVDTKTMKPCKPSAQILDALLPHFS